MVFVGKTGGIASPGRLGEQVLRLAEVMRPPLSPRGQDPLLRCDLCVQQPRTPVRGPACVRSKGKLRCHAFSCFFVRVGVGRLLY